MKKFNFLFVLTLVMMTGFVSVPKAEAAFDIAVASAKIISADTVLVTFADPGEDLNPAAVDPTK